MTSAARLPLSICGPFLLGTLLQWEGCTGSAPPAKPATGETATTAVGISNAASQAPGQNFQPQIIAWRTVEDFDRPLAQMETVFWEPADTISLRRLIRETGLVRGKRVLEIGTGTGLISLCCLHAGAARVVATDVNPAALANATFNAGELGVSDRLEVRLVSTEAREAFRVLAEGEQFDLIISNPPWEDQLPESMAQYALYDPNFVLLRSLLSGLPERLKPSGEALLAYGCRTAIRTIRELAPEYGLQTVILDDRDPEMLPEVFLPGMLLRVTALPVTDSPTQAAAP